MRYLSPQTFLLLVAALALLLGGGLWWASRLIGGATLRTAPASRPARQQVTLVRRAESVAAAVESTVPALLAAREVAVPAASEEHPAGAKILRRNRGFSSARQPALRSGSYEEPHVEAMRPKPIA